MTTAVIERREELASQTSTQDNAIRLRACELLRSKFDFIPNPEFDAVRNPGDAEFVEEMLRATGSPSQAPSDLPAHLRRFCESDLLTHEQEKALFREMNYLKYRAHALRSELDPERANPQSVAEIESLIEKAQEIRDHIIKANTRLVMSIVKKFVTPQQSFDDMLSDGTFTLMQAVDKFDYDRGFRFSTYAYRAIARSAYRSVKIAQKEEARVTRDAEEWAFDQADDRNQSLMSDQYWSNLRELTAAMLGQLDRRERFIIRSRYALGAHRKTRTFQCLADKLGVSKERVRQLEKRAVTKLRGMAAKFDMDELFGAAMV